MISSEHDKKKRHAATAMEKSERSSDQSWACFGFLSRRFGFRRSLGFRRSSTASETHAHAIQKPRSTIQQPKCAIQKRWDRRPLPHTYLQYIFTLFTFILLSVIYKCFINPYTKKSTVSCTRVNHYGVYGICVMHITLKTIHNYRQIYQMDYPWMMFFMFWFTHLPESEVSSYPPAILPVARLARMVKAVAVEDPGFFSTRWGSLDFIWFYHIPPPPRPPPPPPPPHTRAPDRSGHSRTSTASSRSQWAQPDLNRELQI